ncbi:hypothetical protein [Neisseria cinerea]|uniref:hypothetical protein n=1 Tax=Neisseria cinerea TaxID=483 RepID=UPI002B1D22CD|nr:hypothetical protein [Neisseria cinerea]
MKRDDAWIGSQNRLAKAVRESGGGAQMARRWRHGRAPCQKIEELTGGKVTAKQISDGIRR